MAGALSCRGPPRPDGSLVGPDGRPTAVPAALVERIEALRRQRWTGQRIATRIGFGQRRPPRPQALGPRAPRTSRARRAALRNGLGGRAAAPGHREARGSPRSLWHDGRSPDTTAQRLGVRARLRRRRLARRVRRDPARRAQRPRVSCAAAAWLAHAGVRIQRVMTDNGPGYIADDFKAARAPGRAPSASRPYTRARTAKPNASSSFCASGPTTSPIGARRSVGHGRPAGSRLQLPPTAHQPWRGTTHRLHLRRATTSCQYTSASAVAP